MNSMRLFIQLRTKSSLLFQRTLYTENIQDLVSSGKPSIVWNADALHGLSKEQVEFRQNVRAFAEKELPEELVTKVGKIK